MSLSSSNFMLTKNAHKRCHIKTLVPSVLNGRALSNTQSDTINQETH